MAGRRLRSTIDTAFQKLVPEEKGRLFVPDVVAVGCSRSSSSSPCASSRTILVSGLTNGYCGYLATREEYSAQHYEGASTHFGPNQLAATQQIFHQLAGHLMRGSQPPLSSVAMPSSEDKFKINYGPVTTYALHPSSFTLSPHPLTPSSFTLTPHPLTPSPLL
jgi:hypothetical protein